MDLTSLDLNYCAGVSDLSPLKGMHLPSLNLTGCNKVRDLSPLQGMNLSYIYLPPAVDQGMGVLRRMKALANINLMPPVEFWKKYDAGEFKQYK